VVSGKTGNPNELARSLDEIAICREAPAMVRTGERTVVAMIVAAQSHAAMGTAIEQDLDLALTVARQNDRIGPHLREEVIVRIRDKAFVPYKKPCLGEDAFDLRLENLFVG